MSTSTASQGATALGTTSIWTLTTAATAKMQMQLVEDLEETQRNRNRLLITDCVTVDGCDVGQCDG